MTNLKTRDCGACTVCCTELKVDTPEFRKKSQVPCQHLTPAGCGIYETRFPICREFLCGWRLFADLNDGWRPDLSGVVIVRLSPENVPEEYRAPGYGMQLDIVGGEAAITRPGFAEYVAAQIKRGVAVQMSAASPAMLVNVHLDPATVVKDIAGTRAALLKIYAMLHAARWKKGIGMLVPLYRLKLAQQKALVTKSGSK